MSGRVKVKWLPLLSLVLVLIYFVGVIWSFETIPLSNTSVTHFDTIIVLGTPSLPNGLPSLEQTTRVLEGVREYRAGVAPHIIMTGGPAHNEFVEAHTMAQMAVRQGVPGSDLTEEGRAQNTVQNIFYSSLLMQQHGWKSAEIVSSPSHLPRAALILEHYTFPWRTHAAPWPPQFSTTHILFAYWQEASYSCKLRWLGFNRTAYLPR